MFANDRFVPKSIDHLNSVFLFDEFQKNKSLVMMTSGAPMELASIEPACHVKFQGNGWIALQCHELSMCFPEKTDVGAINKTMAWIHHPGVVLQRVGEFMRQCRARQCRLRMHPHGADSGIIATPEGPAFQAGPGVEHDQDDFVLTDEARIVVNELDGVDIEFIELLSCIQNGLWIKSDIARSLRRIIAGQWAPEDNEIIGLGGTGEGIVEGALEPFIGEVDLFLAL